MSDIERLDFSKPPPGYDVVANGFDQERFPVERRWHATSELHSSNNHASEANANAAAWTHHKARRDPPGMWSGYCGILPLCDQYRPRMGVSIPGVAHLELYVSAERPGTCEEAKAMGRAAAWAWYEDAVEVADLLDGENGPTETWPERCAWPRPLRWTAEQRNEVRRWVADGGVVAGWAPEVLRGL